MIHSKFLVEGGEKVVKNIVERIHRDQKGQGMAEYGLIIALVAVAAIIAFNTLGGGISNKIDKVNDQLK